MLLGYALNVSTVLVVVYVSRRSTATYKFVCKLCGYLYFVVGILLFSIFCCYWFIWLKLSIWV